MLTLFSAPGSCSLASHLALEFSGLHYSVRRVNFAENEQRSPAFLAINPKGRVPALLTDHGILTETPAILVYIAQLAPQAQLAPFDDAFAFARLQSFNAFLGSTVHVNHAHRYRGYRWTDDAAAIETMKSKVPQNMRDNFRLIDGELLQGPWVMGQQFTVCDPYLYTICRWLPGDEVDINEFPRVAEHYRRMEDSPVVRKVLAA